MKYLFIILCSVAFISCKEEVKTSKQATNLTAQQIIDKAIDYSCHGNCDNATIEFTFRNKKYKSSRNNGAYKLERIKMDSVNEIHDVLTNKALYRYINKELVVVQDSVALNISEGVNSVHFFAQLPYGLNTSTVHKKLLGEDQINDKRYYEIKVTFSEEGGGTDFEDVFVYWINKETFSLDYFAYKYATNEGGVRFREAYNEREVEGIRFVDYNNFKPENKEVNLSDLDNMFSEGKLKLVSKIETKHVSVKILKNYNPQ